jgi:MFS transporter, NNP family, nitrate/nitrite transporter
MMNANATFPASSAPAAFSEPLDESAAAKRVLFFSTLSFTLMFAVWLMFGVLGIKIQEEFNLTKNQFYWLTAIAILNGSIWRLPFGIVAERYGGKLVTVLLMLWGALGCVLVAFATTYTQLMVYAFMLGIVGNSFTVGIAWNSAWFSKERQGVAMGTFGAGNVGASITKLIGPAMIAFVPAGGALGGWIPGGWRFVPMLYAVLLVIMAVVLWYCTPRVDRKPGQGRAIREMLKPIGQLRVWCFGLYYVVVFGAYVALSLVLPNYYKVNYGLDLQYGALLAALFVFPASLLRPLGGWLSDKFGAGRITYGVFVGMLLVTLPLALPNKALGIDIGVGLFTTLVVLIGVGMGIGKASAYKFIAELYPRDVGATGGLMGMLGALGGFFLPLMGGYVEQLTGAPNALFFIILLLIASSFLWLHLVVSGREWLVSDHAIPMATGLAFFLVLWGMVGFGSDTLPGPLTTAQLCVKFVREHFWGDSHQLGIPQLLLYSLSRGLLGFGLAALVAIPFGFLLGVSRFANSALNPIIAFCRQISPLAWYPVALVLFSTPAHAEADTTGSNLALLFVVFLCALWPVVVQTAEGIRNVNNGFVEYGRMLGYSAWKMFWNVYWPAAMPRVIVGLKSGLGYAWMVIIAAEMLSGQDGIGLFCWNQYRAGAIAHSLFAIALVGATGVLLNVLMTLLERRVASGRSTLAF